MKPVEVENDSESEAESRPLLPPSGFRNAVNNGTSKQSPTPSVTNRNLFLASGAMLLGSLCLGITLGMSSPMIPDIQKDESAEALTLSDSDISWFGSMITLGAMVGGLLGGFLIQFFGRKLTAMICGLPFVGGMLLIAYATNVSMLLAGRAMTGFAGGVASLVVPVDVDVEFRELEEAIGRSVGSASWYDVLSEREIWKPLAISLGVLFFQQFSGINCVTFYCETILRNAGFTSDALINLALLLIAIIPVIIIAITCVLMDKVGRKILLYVSGGIMAVSLGTCGLYFQLASETNRTNGDLTIEEMSSPGSSNLNWLVLASLLVYIAAFSAGLGPVPWLLLAEVIPVRARGKASGLSMAVNWALAFLVTKEFSDMQRVFTTQGTYWIFSGICAVGVVYHWLLLPETKGKSLEQISAYFRGTSSSHSAVAKDHEYIGND